MTVETPNIVKNAVFNAPIKKVWDAVATRDGINSWFMPNDFTQELGSEFTIQSPFGPQPCKVTELEPPNKLSFSWGFAGWYVTFELKEVGEKTEFTLTHGGWGAPDEIIQGPGPTKTNLDIRNTMNGGWEALVNDKLRGIVES